MLGDGVIIFDISNPAAPAQIGKIGAASVVQPWQACVRTGNYLYLGSYGIFQIVDVSNPAQPVVTGTLTNGTNGASLEDITSIAVSANYAFVSDANGNAIEVIDVSNPTAPSLAGKIANGQGGALLAEPFSIAVVGNYAYVVSRSSSALEILDITTPATPVHFASLSNGQGGANIYSPVFITITGSLAYLVCNNNIEIVDITTPSSPIHKGGIVDGMGGNGAKLNGASALAISGNYAYVQSTGSFVTEVVDISNPASPAHLTTISGGGGRSIFVSGNFLYRAWSDAMDIVDISNPISPVIKGMIINGNGGAQLSEVSSIFVTGNYAYVVSTNSPATFEIIDVSNPSSPTHVGSTAMSGFATPQAVVISGNYAYVADFSTNLIGVFDVHDPTTPVQVASISDGQGGALLNGPFSIALQGNYLYVPSSYSNALEIIDISNPTSPQHASSIAYGQGGDISSFPESIAVSGNYAFIWSDLNMEIVDITDPYHPLHAGNVSTFWGWGAFEAPGNNVIAIQGNYVYTTGDNGLHVFSIFSPAPVVATSATNVSSSSFTANWNAVAGAAGYHVDVSTDNFNTTVTGYSSASASSTSLQVTGLSGNTIYQYRVRSVNSQGQSLNSNIVSITTLLSAPVATDATAVTQTNFVANWNVVSGATSYLVDVGADPAFSTILNSAATSANSLAFYQRHDSSTYWIRVRAKDAQDTSGYSNVIQVITLPRKQQTIIMSLNNVAIGNSPLTLKAKASSGLPINYASSDTTIAIIRDGAFITKKIGPCTITASQLGDSVYKSVSVYQTICVDPPQPTIAQSGPEPNIVLTSSASSGNQWYLNGSPIPSATDQTLAVPSSGNYTVQVTLNSCSSILSKTWAAVITEIITRPATFATLYPNPASNTVFIDLSGLPAGEPVLVNVTDMLGRSCGQLMKIGGSLAELNVSGYSPGIYLINIGNQSNLMHGKFVKE